MRAKIFRMVSVGVIDEPVNQAYDTVSIIALLASVLLRDHDPLNSLGAALSVICAAEPFSGGSTSLLLLLMALASDMSGMSLLSGVNSRSTHESRVISVSALRSA